MDIQTILRAYDRECREGAAVGDPACRVERDGPVVRIVGPGSSAYENAVVFSRLDASTADAAIRAQILRFAGRAFEWKHYTHDAPDDLDVRLERAGFERGESETLLFREAAEAAPGAPDVEVLKLGPEGMKEIAGLQAAVHGGDFGWLEAGLRRELDGGGLSVYAAFREGRAVASGWIRFGIRFATLHGGATRPEWRGRGLYAALLARRLEEARARGVEWLVSDATEKSRPLLERRGFRPAGRTTPFVWRGRPGPSGRP